MAKKPTWQLIDEIGAAVGAGDEARRKWKSRGVAHKWRIKILDEAKRRRVRISVADMEAIR